MWALTAGRQLGDTGAEDLSGEAFRVRHTVVDELRARGWQEADFNHEGSEPSYCRVGISFARWASIFEPMSRSKRWLRPAMCPTIKSVLAGFAFKIDVGAYDTNDGDHITSRWIENQELFPFGAWFQPIRFDLTTMRVARVALDEPGQQVFEMGYGALIAGQAFELRPARTVVSATSTRDPLTGT